jgi:GNAT superfamily N-acetyltransferase
MAGGATSDLHISTDRTRIDIAVVHRFLSTESSWARGIALEVVRRSIGNSLCFGGYCDGAQVAFARVVSDFATFAYLLDVFVLAPYRGRGFGERMVGAVVGHEQLQGLRRFILVTSSAHGLYARFGFNSPAHPETYMERHIVHAYLQPR